MSSKIVRDETTDGFTLQTDDNGNPVPNRAEVALDNAIKNNPVDRVATPIRTNYDVYYSQQRLKRDITDSMSQIPAYDKYSDITYKKWQVYDKTPGEKPSKGAYEMFKSDDATAMIVTWVYREKDANTGPAHLELSEVQYQTAFNANPADDVELTTEQSAKWQARIASQLQLVMQFQVDNKGLYVTAKKAYDLMNNKDFDKPYKFRRNAGSPVERLCFDALTRTQNVKPTNWELANHHRAFGNKRIQAITVQKASNTLPEHPFYQCNIYLELGTE